MPAFCSYLVNYEMFFWSQIDVVHYVVETIHLVIPCKLVDWKLLLVSKHQVRISLEKTGQIGLFRCKIGWILFHECILGDRVISLVIRAASQCNLGDHVWWYQVSLCVVDDLGLANKCVLITANVCMLQG